jgi:hypothetical protein
MITKLNSFKVFFLLTAGFLAIFIARTLLAEQNDVPRLFDLFNTLTLAGAVIVWLKGFHSLRPGDWVAALILGLVVGLSMPFATLFSPYPFFGIVRDNSGQALVRGFLTFAAALGGLVIMHQGGPIDLHAASANWNSSARGILVGLAVGFPLAVVNVFALQFSMGRGINWQNPGAALLDALQPAVVEEVVFRFALWGLLWLALRPSLPAQAASLAGILAMLVHTFAHFDDLLLQSPLAALGMGLVLTVLWGLPLFFLARRRGLESAVAFHWLQDAARFLAGF